jgi:hypothetical protein
MNADDNEREASEVTLRELARETKKPAGMIHSQRRYDFRPLK